MDVYSLARTCLRQWFIFVPVLALFVVAAFVRIEQAPETFSASTTLVVLPGSKVDANAPLSAARNPFAAGSAGDRTAASALAATLSGNPLTQLPRETQGGMYSVQVVQSQPVLVIVASAPSMDTARSILTTATAQSTSELARIQEAAGAPADSFFQVLPVGDPVDLGSQRAGAVRGLVGVILAGLFFAVFAAVGVEGVRGRRSVSRRRVSEGTATPGVPGFSINA